MDIVTKEFVDTDFNKHSEGRHSLQQQRITTAFVSVTYQLTKFCVIVFVNLQHNRVNKLDTVLIS